MMWTILGWILWCLVAIFSLGCLVGSSRHSNAVERRESRIAGLTMAIGLAVVFPFSKIRLLWVLLAGFLASTLAKVVLNARHLDRCETCGARKPHFDAQCGACDALDARPYLLRECGRELTGIFVLAMLGLGIYRFWILGWSAWMGNLRLAAICVGGFGIIAVTSGRGWSRWIGLIVVVGAAVAFLFLKNL